MLTSQPPDSTSQRPVVGNRPIYHLIFFSLEVYYIQVQQKVLRDHIPLNLFFLQISKVQCEQRIYWSLDGEKMASEMYEPPWVFSMAEIVVLKWSPSGLLVTSQ